ncbi:MAG: hypothetical protein AAF311_10405 [Pseudomonadota bacterium]
MTVLINSDYRKRFEAVAKRNHERFLRLRDDLDAIAQERELTPQEKMLSDELETAITPTEEDLAY